MSSEEKGLVLPNDDYYGFTQNLKRRANTYGIWLIIGGVFIVLFLVMRKLFK